MIENIEKIVARHLLEIKAVQLRPDEPFTWASGWKSPFIVTIARFSPIRKDVQRYADIW